MHSVGHATRRNGALFCLFSFRMVGLAIALSVACSFQASAAKLPNIVFITGDDAGQDDLGVYGHPVHTPNLDRIAREGVRFTNFYVTTSSCSPSRASIWTGKYPHTAGAPNLWDPLPKGQRIIPGFLSEKGYFTGNVGKLHLGEGRGVTHGADQFDRVYSPRTDKIAEEPYAAIDQFLDERPKDRPFFLSVGFKEPHPPFGQRTPPDPHVPEEVWVPPYLPDLPEVRAEIAQYYDEINYLDGWVGRLTDRLSYVRNYYPDTPLWPATDLITGATYQAMLQLLDRRALPPHQAIFFYAVRPEEELYGLENDPFEFENLAHRPEYERDLEHLRAVLDRWVDETDDLSPEDHRHHPCATLRTGEKTIRFGHPLPVEPMDYEPLIQERLQLYEDM